MDKLEIMVRETATEIAGGQEFMTIVAALAQLEQFVPTVKVQDDASKAIASECRARVKTCEKELEAMRKMAGAPYRKMTDTINNLFKPLKAMCAKMVGQLDKEISPYVRKQVEAAEKAQREAYEEALKAQEVDGDESLPAPVKVETTTKTDGGSTFLRRVKKVEVVDVVKLIRAALDNRNKVPFEVVQINEARLKQVAVGDTLKPKQWAKYGVRVYEEDQVTTRT